MSKDVAVIPSEVEEPVAKRISGSAGSFDSALLRSG